MGGGHGGGAKTGRDGAGGGGGGPAGACYSESSAPQHYQPPQLKTMPHSQLSPLLLQQESDQGPSHRGRDCEVGAAFAPEPLPRK